MTQMPTLGSLWHWATGTTAPRATVLVRLLVGVVFASEGLQKFLYPDTLGAGRFTKIGIPAPQLMGPFVGAVELIGGILIIAGLLTRLAAVPLIVDISVAIASTKVPILIGRGYLGFAAPSGNRGFWAMMHEVRTDFCMLLGACFLLAVGAGAWSIDAWLERRTCVTTRASPRS